MLKAEVAEEVARNFLKGDKPLTVAVMPLKEPVQFSTGHNRWGVQYNANE
jgi:hypothetical protein